ncbi:RNA 3'-terminal phosphate cyclase [Litorilinea aerophila]|uniref:RNA 3'-terminal phosphate cyclase n=1 Tax=Litorilinea aerophila TaxID=1204385 RepID=A0A540VGJ7_9CHLR|nr:RNA 3'-terminal phosphate cyclase [Litorilinea aerophila]MCC9076998.1 RNA 3'-terminal phosphate cyclase [Litorilinea aerophila]OUC06954.1 hypothetical protein RY27_17845 [Litorilinea aerophila]
MLLIDGAYGEGGGQILRTALALSLLTDQPFRVENIRQGRLQPGLKPQHLHIVRALLQMSDARVDGLAPGAQRLSFWPGRLRAGHFHLDVGTAGAIPLMLQTLLPVAMFSPGPVTWSLTGGTDVRGAMTLDFWRMVLLPFLRPYARALSLDMERPGFYPAGGGRVTLRVEPRFRQPGRGDGLALPRDLRLDIPSRGALVGIQVISRASSRLRARRVAERQLEAFAAGWSGQPVQPQVRYDDTRSPGSSLTAVALYSATRLGADALGERGKPAEEVGRDAARRLRAAVASDATVDVHTADNLMLWAALFGGSYTFPEVSGHITTNAWVIEHFLPGALQLRGRTLEAPGVGAGAGSRTTA